MLHRKGLSVVQEFSAMSYFWHCRADLPDLAAEGPGLSVGCGPQIEGEFLNPVILS